jgi:hypothetical protein
MARKTIVRPESGLSGCIAFTTSLFVLAFFLSVARSEEPSAAPKAERRTPAGEEVYAGIYVNQIYDLSVKEHRFVADFWIWFRWKDDRLHPLESFKVVDSRETETVYSNEDPEKKNGYHYAQARLRANISKVFDVQHFPRDSHTLTIRIESEHSTAEVKYVADVENCALSRDVRVPGWVLVHPRASVSEALSVPLYGVASAAPASNSRFQFEVDLARPDWGGFFKLYLGLFLSSIIAILSFKLPPHEIDARLALVLTALLGVMLSQFIALKGLPDTTSLTVTDKRHALGLLMVLISLADTGWGKYMSHHHKHEIAERFDRIAFYVIAALYAALHVIVSF